MTQERGKYAVPAGRPGRGYEIIPRPAALGGGWNLTLLENGQEAGGGVFPIPDEDPHAGMDWWNRMTKEARAHWLMMAASAMPADARRAYLLAETYADARNVGEDWINAMGDR
jgi:hypothetical protein